jgi:hypothetical protein
MESSMIVAFVAADLPSLFRTVHLALPEPPAAQMHQMNATVRATPMMRSIPAEEIAWLMKTKTAFVIWMPMGMWPICSFVTVWRMSWAIAMAPVQRMPMGMVCVMTTMTMTDWLMRIRA